MKKTNYLFLLLAAIATTLYSCKKDNDENNSTKIIGKWSIKKGIETEYFNNVLQSTEEETYPAAAYADFKNNGILNWSEDGSDPDTYSYRVDGNKLTLLEEGDDSEVFNIEELSSSRLVISEEDRDTIGNQIIREVNQYILEK